MADKADGKETYTENTRQYGVMDIEQRVPRKYRRPQLPRTENGGTTELYPAGRARFVSVPR